MKKIILASATVVIIAASAGAWFFLKPTETDKKFDVCKTKTLKNIKTPSSAIFGDYRFSPISNYNSTYDAEKFVFSVDAENLFGATIRNNMICYHLYNKDGTLERVEVMKSQ